MRQNSRLIYILFFVISMALFLLSYIFNSISDEVLGPNVKSLLGGISGDVGIVVLSLILVDVLWRSVGGDPLSDEIQSLRSLNRLSRDAEKCGLTRVFAKVSDVEFSYLLELFRECRSNIDLSGWTLERITSNPEWIDTIVAKAKSGVKVRLLIYAPDNPALQQAVVDESQMTKLREDMRYSWQVVQQKRESLPSEVRENLQIQQLTSGIMYCSVRRVDDDLYAIPYLYSEVTSGSPLYVSSDSKPLFNTYLREFDAQFVVAATESQ